MMRWMCKDVKDGTTSEELRCKVVIKSISEVNRAWRLCWFAHVEIKKGLEEFLSGR